MGDSTISKYFDIVIPVGPNDIDIINNQIEYTKKNIIGYRNIYIIINNNNLSIDGCIMINEDIFPFSMQTISNHHEKNCRNGWYLQQLLKLYSGITIPDILDKYLVIDSDTFFFKPTIFYKDGKCMYNYGDEYHKPYFEHMKTLSPHLHKQDFNKSGICHHMMFESKYIKELFDMIEEKHNDLFYNIFLKSVNKEYRNFSFSGASEYEIYFNYILKYHPNEIIVRRLSWRNMTSFHYNDNDDYISVHWYSRKN